MATVTENIILKYSADTKQATQSLDALDQDNDQVAESTASVNDQLDQMPGAAGAAVGGVKKLGVAFKALLANPVVLVIAAIVAGLTALFSAFTRTAEGGDTVSKIFDAIGNSIGPVLDSLGKLASGLVEFFKGNFAEGIDKMSTSFDGLADAIELTWKQSARLVDINRELHNLTVQMTKDEARITFEIAKQRVVLEDLSKSSTERLEANKKILSLNEELEQQTLRKIALELEEAKLQLEIAGQADDEVKAAELRIAQLEAQEFAAAERKFNLIRRIQTFER